MFFELKYEVNVFLEFQRKHELLDMKNNLHWNQQLAYFADIFEQLTSFVDSLKAFSSKLHTKISIFKFYNAWKGVIIHWQKNTKKHPQETLWMQSFNT